MTTRAGPLAPDGCCEVYAAPAELFKALSSQLVWFAAPAAGAIWPQALQARVHRHRCEDAEVVTIDHLTAHDLLPLRSLTRHALINGLASITPEFPDANLFSQLSGAGFKLFFPSKFEGNLDADRSHYALISPIEFLFSSQSRLQEYPLLGGARLQKELDANYAVRRKAVVLLDLVQDFEVLRPLIARAAATSSPFELTVAVTQRFAKSHVGDSTAQFLRSNDIPHFIPIGALDVSAALGTDKALLLTAAESSAAAHAFAHTCCRIAPPRTLRVTVQHGLECIGLLHHRSHDFDFPHGVRFASDVILTWDHVDSLPNLHPAELGKCIAVGVVKATAERCAALSEGRWRRADIAERNSSDRGRVRLLLAENLHSVRFKAPERYQRFLAFVEEARSNQSLDLTMRSHPASRIMEKKVEANCLTFLQGTLRADELAKYEQFVSPPSTVVLDAVCAGVASAIWSDTSELGDANHYRGLPVVTDGNELAQLVLENNGMHAFRAMRWAVGATASLNGVPAAWNRLCHLIA